jgi:hypothetical protein
VLLEISQIPECNWHKSLANLLPRPVWDSVRKDVYSRFNHRCGICKAGNRQLHCHEVWSFNTKGYIQKLEGLICLCIDCHNIVHWGRTVVEYHKGSYKLGYIKQLEEHFCKVNDCTPEDFMDMKNRATMISIARNRYNWTINWGIWNPEKIVSIYAKLNK